MKSATFGSVCSGIEAASVAWHPLGWRAAWLAEIEPFPSAVLAHHYPNTPNLGDMTKLPTRIASGEVAAPDVFCGGTPCQAFSVAGKRESLDDARGNLSLVFCDIADSIDAARSTLGLPPSIVFWENVPGVLSTRDNAFGCFLSQLCGGDEPLVAPDGWPTAGCVSGPSRTAAWRVLDAQYFGLAQRRRRVFVVASARNDFDPAAVLFEFDGVRRDFAPSRGAGQDVAGTLSARTQGGGGLGTDFDLAGGIQVAGTLQANGKAAGSATQQDAECGMLAPTSYAIQAGALRTNPLSGPDGMGVQADYAYTLEARAEVQIVAFGGNNTAGPIDVATARNACASASASASGRMDFESETFLVQSIAFPERLSGTQCASTENLSPSLGALNPTAIAFQERGRADVVRRLTPTECERLQGFPDGYTRIPGWKGWRKMGADETPEQCAADGLEVRKNRKTGLWSVRDADGPRYKALGNSWAVPVVRWLGRRIDAELARIS